MSNRGLFALDRGWFDHPVFANEPFTEREAWAWLISEAAWKPRRKRVGRCIFDLQRGQLVVSERFMAQAWRWERSKVHRFLTRLKTEQMIEPLANHSATVVSVCNYDKYQFLPSGGEPPNEPPNEPLANHSRTKLEEGNNINNVIEGRERECAVEKLPTKKVSTKTSLHLENPDFERFWDQYPKKTEIGTARRLYDRIVLEGVATPDDLLAGAMRYSAERSGEEDRFTKSAANWLNGECWRDESVPRIRQPRTGAPPKSKADSAIEGMMSYFQERDGS